MTLAVLILTIFNTGLIVLCSAGVIWSLKQHHADTAKCINDNVDKDIETLGTAIFNMDRLKQEASKNPERWIEG